MDRNNISRDDVQDIVELGDKVARLLEENLSEIDQDIAMSSLITGLCKFLYEGSPNDIAYKHYLSHFVNIFTIEIKEADGRMFN